VFIVLVLFFVWNIYLTFKLKKKEIKIKKIEEELDLLIKAGNLFIKFQYDVSKWVNLIEKSTKELEDSVLIIIDKLNPISSSKYSETKKNDGNSGKLN